VLERIRDEANPNSYR